MFRVEIAGIVYDIGYEKGFYFASASSGKSPIGSTIEELCEGLSQCTGVKKEDLVAYLNDLNNQ